MSRAPDVVVGASAAGLYAARLLAEADRDVVVLERARTMAPVRRSLIVTEAVRSLAPEATEVATVNRISRFELYADGVVADLTLRSPDLIIERSTLIQVLAEQAKNSGAAVSMGERFLGLQDGSAPALRIKAGGRERVLPAATLIGADGANSTVARVGGWAPQPTVPLLQAIVELPEDMTPNTTRIWFRPEDTPYFYWLIPESPTRGALGVIGSKREDVRGRLDRFLESKDLKAIEYQAAQIPQYERWTQLHRRVGSRDLYLVGDAAGHVKVSTVGGIVTGFRGAKAVSELIQTGDSRERRLLKRELNLHLYLRKVLQRFSQDDYVQVISQITPAAGKALGTHTRDQASRILLALCASRPQMLLHGLRSMLLQRTRDGG